MKAEIDRNRVRGFLDVKGRKLVNGSGEEVLLTGWGLGNWLLCEGYMWNAGDIASFDRPRRMEQTLEKLAGSGYAQSFWRRFRESYITEDDFRLMAQMGYNSVRIPINARLFMPTGNETCFEEGFRLLDRAIAWCEQYGLYAFIDLHGAPGGQTGANIDDSEGDECRLFADPSEYEKGLALWEKIARRYAQRWIVGGYDLLNEPIRPVRWEGDTNLDGYLPQLRQFYGDCIPRIRAVDSRHIIALEGHHWASQTDIFDHVYDPKMVIHFHRYACPPDIAAYRSFLEKAQRLNVPLWLGETGENTLAWFSGMFPLCLELGISLTAWPWKKMDCDNSPCSIHCPPQWRQFLACIKGEMSLDQQAVQDILEDYLKNVQTKNCRINPCVTSNLFRTPGCEISGTDFDEFPGLGISYGHGAASYPAVNYRRQTGMDLFKRFPERGKRFAFDGDWAQYVLRLHEGEWACYSINNLSACNRLEIICAGQEEAELAIKQDNRLLKTWVFKQSNVAQTLLEILLNPAETSVLQLMVNRGSVDVVMLKIK